MSVNLQIIVGNVGQEPIIRNLEGGRSVAAFSVAVTEKYKNKSGELVENTEWFNVSAWQGLAEFADKYIRKGAKLYVEGSTKHTEYEDKDGVKRQKVEVVAHKIDLFDWPAKDGAPSGGSRLNRPQASPQTEPRHDDLPEPDEIDQEEAEGDDLPF
jgi:single-strand DNA-binding protein